jgi:hypothetical protein
MTETYELSIVGGTGKGRRKFSTFEAAEQAALKHLAKYDETGDRAAHPAIIYGPAFSTDGWTVR